MARVTGIGGIFFKSSSDKTALLNWYQDNLGLDIVENGFAILNWKDDHAEDGGGTVVSIADKDSQWFSPSQRPYMINYRIDNMEEMISQLKANGTTLHNGPEYHENGVFAWIMDPEGNKIELWEPMIWDEKNKTR